MERSHKVLFLFMALLIGGIFLFGKVSSGMDRAHCVSVCEEKGFVKADFIPKVRSKSAYSPAMCFCLSAEDLKDKRPGRKGLKIEL